MALAHLILIAALASGPAPCQETAVPVEHHAAAPPPESVPPETAPIALPAEPGARPWAALRTYRDRSLQVRGVTSWSGGGATVIHGGWGGWGPRPRWHWGLGTSFVLREPREQVHDWAVFQGPERLGVPAFFDAVGDGARASALRDEQERAQRGSRAFYAVGGLGVGATLVGLVGAVNARHVDAYHAWNAVAGTGLVAAVVGLVVGPAKHAQAVRIEHDFRGALSYEDARQRVQGYNAALRQELGIGEAEAWEIEEGEGPRPPRR